jgi:hypothetical protein
MMAAKPREVVMSVSDARHGFRRPIVCPWGTGWTDSTEGERVVALLYPEEPWSVEKKRYRVEVDGKVIGHVVRRPQTFQRKPRGSRIATSRWESDRWFDAMVVWNDHETIKKAVVRMYEDLLEGRGR